DAPDRDARPCVGDRRFRVVAAPLAGRPVSPGGPRRVRAGGLGAAPVPVPRPTADLPGPHGAHAGGSGGRGAGTAGRLAAQPGDGRLPAVPAGQRRLLVPVRAAARPRRLRLPRRPAPRPARSSPAPRGRTIEAMIRTGAMGRSPVRPLAWRAGWIVSGIVAAAAALRGYQLGRLSFWYDEVVTMRLARTGSPSALIDLLFQID